MLSQRALFLRHLAQTTDFPLSIEVESAEGLYITDTSGKKYMDMISGISVSNIGHRNPEVVQAIKDQLDKYMHVMVYGEYVQSPQVELGKLLSSLLPPSLNSVYLVNSGAEAVDGSMKLVKRFTGRSEIISMKDAYHGSSQGPLSIMGNEKLKNAFRPLIPGNRIIRFNNFKDLDLITTDTAGVFVEPIQGEAGIIVPTKEYLKALREKCSETGSLLVFDEIQTGYGRTGKLFAFEHYDLVPDILIIAKGMGGGMPLAAFIAPKQIMDSLKFDPILGHITTFGGHPVCCAAGLATLKVVMSSGLVDEVEQKEKLFRELLIHPSIKSVKGKGLLLALEFESFQINKKIIDRCIEKGVITDWFLFCDKSMRIAPPLIISTEEIKTASKVIVESIEEIIREN